MKYIGTSIFYIILLFVLCFFCNNGKKTKNKGLVKLAYVILFIVTAIRFDVGNDFESYFSDFKYIFFQASSSGKSLIDTFKAFDGGEFSFTLFSWTIGKLFPLSAYPLLFAIYGFVTVYFLYKTLDKYNCHTLGLLIFFLSEVIFFSWDGIRQGAAMAIVLYAMTFAQEKKFLNYLIWVGVAVLFHTSALLMIPFYFLTYLRLNRWLGISLIGITLIGFWSGVFNEIVEQASVVFSFMDNDYSRYENSIAATLETFESINWKIRVTVYALFWMSTILLIKEEDNFFVWMITFGSIIFILANGSLVFYRVSLYFSVAIVLATPLAFYSHQIKLKKMILIIMICGMGLFFAYDTMTGSYTRGCVPYKTILSEDARLMRFKN